MPSCSSLNLISTRRIIQLPIKRRHRRLNWKNRENVSKRCTRSGMMMMKFNYRTRRLTAFVLQSHFVIFIVIERAFTLSNTVMLMMPLRYVPFSLSDGQWTLFPLSGSPPLFECTGSICIYNITMYFVCGIRIYQVAMSSMYIYFFNHPEIVIFFSLLIFIFK